MAKQQRYEVTGTHAVHGVPPGGTLELDPQRVNVDALVQAGHVKPVEPAKTKKGEDE